MSAEMLTAALRYRARGWSPIPFNHRLKNPPCPRAISNAIARLPRRRSRFASGLNTPTITSD